MTGCVSVEAERAKRLIAMGEMAASLAHEIRNPLGSMELFCSLLKKDLQKQPQLLNLADQIHKGIKSLDRIITNCLQFARDIVPQLKPLNNPRALLQEITESMKPKLEAAGIEAEVECLGSGEARADRYQLQQALLNLFVNAIDAVEQSAREQGAEKGTPQITDTLE